MKLIAITLNVGLFVTTLAIPLKAAEECENVNPTPAVDDCEIDLTVAVDMSLAMNSIANVAELVDDLLANFFTDYDINNVHTALIIFGFGEIQNIDYFDNYGEICYHLTAAENQAMEIGLRNSSLSRVYTTYLDHQLITGRNLKKVFLVATAITDPNNIDSTVNVANQIRSQNGYIILVSLNNPNQLGNLSQIADQVFFTSDYTVGNVSNIISDACQFSGSTTAVPPSTTSSPSTDPSSNAIGTPCSTNSTNAWLDLYFVIDVSDKMTEENFVILSGQLATLFDGLTIGQTPKQSTRVGIITYASNATVQLNLTACNAFRLTNIIFDLDAYHQPNDTGTNIKFALETVLDLKKKEQSYRPMAIIIVAADYDKDNSEDPTQIAEIIKQDGIAILTIAFEASIVVSAELKKLSTLGYAYENIDPQLFDKLFLALTQINCFCPPKTYQFKIYNDTTGSHTTFADCLYGSDGALDPAIAERICEGSGAVLASVTSVPKLDFIIDNVIHETMPKSKQFTVGAHLVDDQWVWFGYNGTVYPVGDYPVIPTNEQGSYTYFNNSFGFNWGIHLQDGGFKNAKSYICQSRACDADFLCNVN
uniref:VWFA domain-containing protein n=1 Tax=Panagrolaimus sp. JU765 TaxID=591449 RepID=A0AC34RAY9_9BILA